MANNIISVVTTGHKSIWSLYPSLSPRAKEPPDTHWTLRNVHINLNGCCGCCRCLSIHWSMLFDWHRDLLSAVFCSLYSTHIGHRLQSQDGDASSRGKKKRSSSIVHLGRGNIFIRQQTHRVMARVTHPSESVAVWCSGEDSLPDTSKLVCCSLCGVEWTLNDSTIIITC